MKSLKTVEKDFRDELDKSKTFMRTYKGSIPFKLLALYVFLLFSIIMTVFYIPVKYMYSLTMYRLFRTFNEITPNGYMFDIKSYNQRAEVKD